MQANKHGLIPLLLLCALALAACSPRVGDYGAASAISRNGFAVNGEEIRRLDGKEVKLWGYVDHGNLYGDDAVKQLLGDWWSGAGPDADTWQFNMKANAGDKVGQSFAVRVRNDAGRDALLEHFLADAEAQRPTRVFVTGTLSAFDAPTNAATQTGFSLDVASSQAIRLDP